MSSRRSTSSSTGRQQSPNPSARLASQAPFKSRSTSPASLQSKPAREGSGTLVRADSQDSVKVAIRCRPFTERELSSDGENFRAGIPCVTMQDDKLTISDVHGRSHIFKFDFLFDSLDTNKDGGPVATQEYVFDAIGLGLVKDALQGYNATIFAYGQTGSGKSYSMVGSKQDPGLVPRIGEALFQSMGEMTGCRHAVEISMMEIYNENVRDLFCPVEGASKSLRVREHPQKGPYVEGLMLLAVNSYYEIENLMAVGFQARTIASTYLNNTSSRAHNIVQIVVTRTQVQGDSERHTSTTSVINLVDLAGSERVTAAHTDVGDRLKEAANINRSLSALGNCIHALVDSRTRHHVPFRDSVLTWLLKNSLGGNAKTVMIATISPSLQWAEESLSTLRYADRAKQIMNVAVVNEAPEDKLIRELREEIEMLRSELRTNPNRSLVAGARSEVELLRDKLEENQRLFTHSLAHANKSWEEKLAFAQQTLLLQKAFLKDHGVGLALNMQDQKLPHLVNLNEDPLVSECLIYFVQEGKTVVGSQPVNLQDEHAITLSGVHILQTHCELIRSTGSQAVTVTPCSTEALVFVNGVRKFAAVELAHSDRLILGVNQIFRFHDPLEAERLRALKDQASVTFSSNSGASSDKEPRAVALEPDAKMLRPIYDWDFAKKELAAAQIEELKKELLAQLTEQEAQLYEKAQDVASPPATPVKGKSKKSWWITSDVGEAERRKSESDAHASSTNGERDEDATAAAATTTTIGKPISPFRSIWSEGRNALQMISSPGAPRHDPDREREGDATAEGNGTQVSPRFAWWNNGAGRPTSTRPDDSTSTGPVASHPRHTRSESLASVAFAAMSDMAQVTGGFPPVPRRRSVDEAGASKEELNKEFGARAAMRLDNIMKARDMEGRLIRLLPEVNEANAMCVEMEQDVLFSIWLRPPEDLAAASKKGATPPPLLVKVKLRHTQEESLLRPEQFEEHLVEIREMYARFKQEHEQSLAQKLSFLARLTPKITDKCSVLVRNVSAWYRLADGLKKQVLWDLYMDIRPGELYGIFGPSGGGKSTVLDLISVHASSTVVSGKIYMNGKNVLDLGRGESIKLPGHMPQEDHFPPLMTALEVLLFHAHLRLPPSLNVTEKRDRALAVMDRLGLHGVRHTVCGGLLPGGFHVRGITQGEKRRLSAACVTIGEASLLCLDEPATGLDSLSSMILFMHLKYLAGKGHTVVLTMQHPSPSAWELMDKVFVLSNGRPMYEGPKETMMEWFTDCLGMGPSGVIARIHPVDYVSQLVTIGFSKPMEIFGRQSIRTELELKQASDTFQASIKGRSHWRTLSSLNRASPAGKVIPVHHQLTSYFNQMVMLTWREALQYARAPTRVYARLLATFLLGVLFGLAFHWGASSDLLGRKNLILASSGVMTLLPFARGSHFLADRYMFGREYASGLYGCMPFYLSYTLVDLTLTAATTFTFAAPMHLLSGLQGRFLVVFLFLFLLRHISSLLLVAGAILSTSQDVALLLGLLCVSLVQLAGGHLARLPLLLRPLSFLSYIRYAVEGLLNLEVLASVTAAGFETPPEDQPAHALDGLCSLSWNDSLIVDPAAATLCSSASTAPVSQPLASNAASLADILHSLGYFAWGWQIDMLMLLLMAAGGHYGCVLALHALANSTRNSTAPAPWPTSSEQSPAAAEKRPGFAEKARPGGDAYGKGPGDSWQAFLDREGGSSSGSSAPSSQASGGSSGSTLRPPASPSMELSTSHTLMEQVSPGESSDSVESASASSPLLTPVPGPLLITPPTMQALQGDWTPAGAQELARPGPRDTPGHQRLRQREDLGGLKTPTLLRLDSPPLATAGRSDSPSMEAGRPLPGSLFGDRKTPSLRPPRSAERRPL
eukprot:jgi/Mesvir1/27315/Mv07139-RA.2